MSISGSTIPAKRTHEENEANVQQSIEAPVFPALPGTPTPNSPGEKHSKPALPNGASRQPSPAPSLSASSLTSITATPPPPSSVAGHLSASNGPAPKRRKLTLVEKQQQRQEKEAKQKEREQKKANKEIAQALKDEQRRRKNEERETKKRQQELGQAEKNKEREVRRAQKEAEQREKDERKREKEDAKKREDEERAKKERVGFLLLFLRHVLGANPSKAQSRINAFFGNPKTPVKAAAASVAARVTPKPTANHILSVEETQKVADLIDPSSLQEQETSDYDRHFLPFTVRNDVRLVPTNHHTWDIEALQHMQRELDATQEHPFDELPGLLALLQLGPVQYRAFVPPTVNEIMQLIEGTAAGAADLSGLKKAAEQPLRLLQQIPIKYLEFAEDVRPAYVGSNTSIRSVDETLRLARNPFRKDRPDIDYDYDSEAEWEEPEEGEDILSEGESESGSEADDMEDFLDDEDADGQRPKKRFLKVDMHPISTGLCFEDEKGCLAPGIQEIDLEALRLEPLHGRSSSTSTIGDKLTRAGSQTFPLDPLNYGTEPVLATSSKSKDSIDGRAFPQHKKADISSAAPGFLQPKAPAPKQGKASKTLEGAELDQFKSYVEGDADMSLLSKVGVLAVMKRHFPKATNEVLKNTLEAVATKAKGPEGKKWVLMDTMRA